MKWWGHKKTEQLRKKLNRPDIHHALTGNGNHKIYVAMNDGAEYELANDGELISFGPWHYHTAQPNKPLPIDLKINPPR